jgi:hypothetical protein
MAVSCLQLAKITAHQQSDITPGRALYQSCQRGKTETHIGVRNLSSITSSGHLLDARLQVFPHHVFSSLHCTLFATSKNSTSFVAWN